MKNLFEHTGALWIRYSSYEYKTDSNGDLYITVSKDAKPEMYRPMQEAEQLIIDAVNVGLAAMHKVPEEELKEAVLAFVKKYGLLGFMTALPTTADFITYESVYLPKNHFIKEETLPTENYLSYFYPFDKPDFRKKGVESGWSVTDREGIAITMAMGNAPQAVAMELQKGYAERYDWIVKEFTDLAFTFMTSFLYYMDYDTIDEQTRSLYRQGISAFGGISPTYRIALEKDAPVIVWDFHSLLIMVQMCFSFMLTDKDSDMRMCKHCNKAFVASRKGNEFCSQKCKNLFVRKKNRLELNGNGEYVLELTQKLLEEADSLTVKAREFDRRIRTIVLGVCAPAPVWRLAPLLSNLYPHMALQTETDECRRLLAGLENNIYQLIAVNEKPEGKQYCYKECGKESLMFALPKGHRYSRRKSLSFAEMNGENVLLMSDIGFWNFVQTQKMPDSRFLTQSDRFDFNELVQASSLASFTSDLAEKYIEMASGRINVPISDEEATVTYYLVCKAENKKSLYLYFRLYNRESLFQFGGHHRPLPVESYL